LLRSVEDGRNFGIKVRQLLNTYLSVLVTAISVPNNPIESPIPSRLPWQHNRIQSVGSNVKSIGIINYNLLITKLTGLEDRGGGATFLC